MPQVFEPDIDLGVPLASIYFTKNISLRHLNHGQNRWRASNRWLEQGMWSFFNLQRDNLLPGCTFLCK